MKLQSQRFWIWDSCVTTIDAWKVGKLIVLPEVESGFYLKSKISNLTGDIFHTMIAEVWLEAKTEYLE